MNESELAEQRMAAYRATLEQTADLVAALPPAYREFAGKHRRAIELTGRAGGSAAALYLGFVADLMALAVTPAERAAGTKTEGSGV